MNAKYLSNFTSKALAVFFAVSAIFGVPGGVSVRADTPEPVIGEYGVPEGSMLIEGDMLIPAGSDRATYQVNLWPSGDPTVIAFRFDTTGTDAVIENATCPASGTCNQTAMLNAMAAWEAVADVDFRSCSPSCSGAFIHIRDSTNDPCPAPNQNLLCPTNSSWVGMKGSQQVMNISAWASRFVMAHELGHALGFEHEQGRADRNTFVQINCANLDANSACNDVNFGLQSGGGNYGPYDFDSVMHYGQCAFSCCSSFTNPPGPDCCPDFPTCSSCAANPAACRTVTVLPPNTAQWQNTIGQRNHLSEWDIRVMSFLYPEGNWRFLDNQCGSRGALCSIFGACVVKSGSFFCPYVDDLPDAVNQTPSGGTLWILAQDAYLTGGTLSKPMTIRAPLGALLRR